MDEIGTNSRAGSDRGSGEELELADYLQGLLTEAVAQKTSIDPLRWRAPLEEMLLDRPSDRSDQPRETYPPGLDQGDTDLPEAPSRSHTEVPSAGRASMSEELAALFRPTEQPPPVASEGSASPETPAAMSEARTHALEPSVYLRRFLLQAARPADVLPSGIADLDALLDGGFGSGLHLVAGGSKAARTAFLDSVVWETVTSERPVVYYSLCEGGLAVWERFIRTLSGILGVPTVALAALRVRNLAAVEVEALTLLDEALQQLVLPLVSLVDSIPSHQEGHTSLLEDMTSRIREARERYGRTPLLVVEDLERLSLLVRPRRGVHMLSRLGEVLSANSAPGLVATTISTELAGGQRGSPERTKVVLQTMPSAARDDFEMLHLRVVGNGQTGRTGSLRLLIDRQTGLLSESSSTTRPEVTPQ